MQFWKKVFVQILIIAAFIGPLTNCEMPVVDIIYEKGEVHCQTQVESSQELGEVEKATCEMLSNNSKIVFHQNMYRLSKVRKAYDAYGYVRVAAFQTEKGDWQQKKEYLAQDLSKEAAEALLVYVHDSDGKKRVSIS